MKKLVAAVAFVCGLIVGYIIGLDNAVTVERRWQYYAHSTHKNALAIIDDELDENDSPAA